MFRKYVIAIIFSAAISANVNADCDNELLNVNVDGVCTQISTYKSSNLSEKPYLIVTIHGDSLRYIGDVHYEFSRKIANIKEDTVAIGLTRPGYRDNNDRTSDGIRGEAAGDNYDKTRVDQVAGAIKSLRNSYSPKKLVLVGYSGGAAIAANLIALYPDLVNQTFLVACPCDLDAWREHMYKRTEFDGFIKAIDKLSPIELVQNIRKDMNITIIVGENDDVAIPILSQNYKEELNKEGIEANLEIIKGDHDIFRSESIVKQISDRI